MASPNALHCDYIVLYLLLRCFYMFVIQYLDSSFHGLIYVENGKGSVNASMMHYVILDIY